MSYSFDQAAHAVEFLLGEASREQKSDVAFYLNELIQRWHCYSHENGDVLNRGDLTGRLPALLDTAMRYEDNDERSRWLALK